MKRALKALFALTVALVLSLTLLSGGMALAAGPGEGDAPYCGYLVLLQDPPEDAFSLFAVPETPLDLLCLHQGAGIYKAQQLSELRDLVYAGRVALVEPDYEVELFDVTADPDDEYFNSSTYQYNLKGPSQFGIGVQAAWDAGLSGDGVTVAVIDSGLDVAHRDVPVRLAEGMAIYYREYGLDPEDSKHPEDFPYIRNEDGSFTRAPDASGTHYGYFGGELRPDTVGHGTAVSGMIAANTNNGLDIAGVAPNVTLLPIQTFFNEPGYVGGLSSHMISALGMAVQMGADVINMSWGIKNNSATLLKAIDEAYKAGCILVAAVGNDGNTSYRYPAAFPNVIGVGGTDRAGQIASFSQRNDSVAVCAPGKDVYSLAAGTESLLARCNGTSFASPQVAAVAALLLEADPALTQADFLELLKATSLPVSNSTIPGSGGGAPINIGGAGLINVRGLVDAVGSRKLILTAEAGKVRAQTCYHPMTAAGFADSTCLLLTAGYNSAGHLVESVAQSVTRSEYGGYQTTVTFARSDVTTVRAFLLRADATLSAPLPPVEGTIGA